MNTSTLSKFFNLNLNDFEKGLIMAVFAAVATVLQNEWAVHAINWSDVLHVAVTAAVAYLMKNLLTTSDGKFAGIVHVG